MCCFFPLAIVFSCCEPSSSSGIIKGIKNKVNMWMCVELLVPLRTPSPQSFGECSSGSQPSLLEGREARLWREETGSHAVWSSLSSASGSEESLQRKKKCEKIMFEISYLKVLRWKFTELNYSEISITVFILILLLCTGQIQRHTVHCKSFKLVWVRNISFPAALKMKVTQNE